MQPQCGQRRRAVLVLRRWGDRALPGRPMPNCGHTDIAFDDVDIYP